MSAFLSPRLHTLPAYLVASSALTVALSWSTPLRAEDWPQWRGPARDGRSGERGVLRQWGDSGPRIVWRRAIGIGFSGLSVLGDRLFTVDATGIGPDGEPTGDEAVSWVTALSIEDGSELWRTRLDQAFADPRGSGPRSTPTVTGNRLYVLGGRGAIVSLDLEGREIWRRHLVEEFHGELPLWGYSSSVLIEGDLAILAGGGEDHALVALDRSSGEVRWHSGTAPPSYASPIVAEIDGVRQIVQLAGDRVLGVSLDGHPLWSHPWPVINNINVATPLLLPRGRVLLATSYDVGSALLEARREGAGWRVGEVWRSRNLKNHFHMSVHLDGYLYGFDNAMLECVDADSGEIIWRHRGMGKGSLLLLQPEATSGEAPILIVLSERGTLSLVAASPEGFRELSSAAVLGGRRSWTAPSLAAGQLYLRNESEILRLDLRSPQSDLEHETAALGEALFAGRGGASWDGVDGFTLNGHLNRNGYLMELAVSRRRMTGGSGGVAEQVRVERSFRGRSEIFLWDGERGWLRARDADSFEPLPIEAAEQRRLEADLLAGFPDAPLRWPRPRRVHDADESVAIETARSVERPVRWFLAGDPPKIVRAELAVEEEGQWNEASIYYFDFEPAEPSGLVFPRTVEWDEGTYLLTLEVASVEIANDLPPLLFRPP